MYIYIKDRNVFLIIPIVGGTEMDFAGDSAGGAKNVVNCRCVIIYADEQDIVLD